MQLTVVLEIFCVGLLGLAAAGVSAWAAWSAWRLVQAGREQ